MTRKTLTVKRKEVFRLKRLCSLEEEIHQQGFDLIAGMDEVGRGPLAGPLVAAACILPTGYRLEGINDSKKLDPNQLYHFYKVLVHHKGVAFGIGVVEPYEIDQMNIHHATLQGMARALVNLRIKPAFLLVDGKYVPPCEVPCEAIVKGDGQVQVIAAASILAKVTRDHMMFGYHTLYPEYGFDKHKGYGTKKHWEAIRLYGLTPIHRRSFVL